MYPPDLPARWRVKAAELSALGAEGQAATLELCAEDLAAAWHSWETEPLTLREAAEESGYSYDALQHLVGGTIPNVGEMGSPRVRRRDLPRKPGTNSTRRRVEQDVADERMARELAR